MLAFEIKYISEFTGSQISLLFPVDEMSFKIENDLVNHGNSDNAKTFAFNMIPRFYISVLIPLKNLNLKR